MREKLVLERAREEGWALAFNDVRLRPAHSEIMPDEVNLETMFSRNVGLKIPIVSAAMDTVTESRLAIQLAKLGGLGVIHRGLTIEKQASEVAKVKHSLHGLIENPICAKADDTVLSLLNSRNEKGYSFHSFPVIDDDGKLVGIVTQTDVLFCRDYNQKLGEIMTSNLFTASKGITMDDAYEVMMKNRVKVLPLVDENGKISGMYAAVDLRRIMDGSAVNYNLDDKGQLRVGAAVGVGNEALKRVKRLYEKGIDVIVIDTAHGDSKGVIDTLKRIKNRYPKLDVVVGDVSIGDSAKRLADEGADGIKIGQGPGSICTTRIIAGVGRPQLAAVYDCARVLEGYNIPLCADGGITYSGDITIAIAAGADSVMIGSLLAGTDETPVEIVLAQGRQWKSYRGMGSLGAMKQHKSSRQRYLQEGRREKDLIPEGVEGLAPYRGKLEGVIKYLVGGLKQGMGYIGVKDISELRENTEFDRVTNAGINESHPHDVNITEEAPNYRGR